MTLKQQRALKALAESKTMEEAIKAAGIDRKTMYRYLHNQEFKNAYKGYLNDAMNDATRQLKLSLQPALTALVAIVGNEEAAPGARIMAAKAILEYSLRFSEAVEIQERLERLESMVNYGKLATLKNA